MGAEVGELGAELANLRRKETVNHTRFFLRRLL